jgi:hypothetical protein
MTPCAPTEHSVRLVEMDHDGAAYYIAECERCLSMVPVPSGICAQCDRFMDVHFFFLSDSPVCPSNTARTGHG